MGVNQGFKMSWLLRLTTATTRLDGISPGVVPVSLLLSLAAEMSGIGCLSGLSYVHATAELLGAAT